MDQLDALAMGEAVILRIEITALVEFRLQTLVVDHRLHAVLIWEGEIKQLQFDRYRLTPMVGSKRYRSNWSCLISPSQIKTACRRWSTTRVCNRNSTRAVISIRSITASPIANASSWSMVMT